MTSLKLSEVRRAHRRVKEKREEALEEPTPEQRELETLARQAQVKWEESLEQGREEAETTAS